MTTRQGIFRGHAGKLLAAVAGLFIAAGAIGTASAQYPERDITFIVPYSPGGGSDQQARRLQPGLEKALGVGIRIVYKAGGGGAIGFSELYGSKPDGYTISNVVVPNIIVTAKKGDVGYKPEEFSYIGMTAQAVGALMVPKGSPFKTLDEFVAHAKANPGKLTVAGVGGTGEVNTAKLTKLLGIEISYVPVSGGVGKMIPMLAGKHVDAGVTSSSHAVRHSATVDTLVIAGDKPVELLASVPNEPGWQYTTTWGVMAPPGTPDEIVAKLNEALNQATPPVREMVVKNGLSPMTQSPAEAKQFVADAIAAN